MNLDIFDPKRASLQKQAIFVSILINIILFVVFLIFALSFYDFFTKHPLPFCLIYAISALIISYVLNKLLGKVLYKDLFSLEQAIEELSLLDAKVEFHYKSNSNYKKISDSLNQLKDSYYLTLEQISTTNRENKRIVESLQKEMQYKKKLVSTISHEIKTPLTIIHATINGIIDNIFPQEEIPNELSNILTEIEKTNSMLQEIINVYHIESKEYVLVKEQLILNELIDDTINDFSKLINKYKHSLVFNSTSAIKVLIDKKEFARVLNNVLLNAITHSPKEAQITINLYKSGKKAVLEIINSKVTIPANEIGRVFEPFYQVDKARVKRDGNGNGLGLYVVSEILKKHEVEFGIENLDDCVKFYILFPQSSEKAPK